MYRLLGEMIKSAEDKDRERVLRLDRYYETLCTKVYSGGRPDLVGGATSHFTESDLAYENCRLAAVFSVTAPAESREDFLEDARKRYRGIPKPSP